VYNDKITPYVQMMMITCNTPAGTEIDLNEQKHTCSLSVQSSSF